MEKAITIAALVGGFVGLVLFITILDIGMKVGAIKKMLEESHKAKPEE